IAHAWQIFHAAASDEHDGMLLKIVADSRYIGSDFKTRRQLHASHFPQSRVRLFGGRRVDASANAAALRTGRERGRLGFNNKRVAAIPYELINCRHVSFLPISGGGT